MTKKITVISILIAVLISLVPLSVFSYSGGEYDIILVPTLEDIPKTQSTKEDYTWASTIKSNNRVYYNLFRRPGDFEGDIYTFAVKEQNGWKPIFVTTEDSSVSLNIQYSQNYDSNWKYSGTKQYSSDYELYYWTPSTIFYSTSFGSDAECYLTEFNSVDAGLSTIRTGLNSGSIGGPTVIPREGTVSVEPGYVAYIAVGGGSITLYQDFPTKFGVEGIVTNQYYRWASELPSSNFIVNSSNSGYSLAWVQVPNTRDLLLRSSKGYIDTIPTQVGYFVVYNPIQALPIKTGEDYGTNSKIRVSCSDLISVVQYPLVSSLENGRITGSGNFQQYFVADNAHIDEFGNIDYLYYDVDEQGNVVTSSAINLPAGGFSEIIEDDTSINGFIGKILELLQAPIRHIKQLFDAGSSFMLWLSQLWIWLPSDVTVVIASALVVLVVIGVIKFLWK